MATFVLIHGAWHGGWCWKLVAPALRRAGHEVYAPSLTGLGERRHLAGREVDLDTHIEDVVALLEMEALERVILLGHSYGGMVVTGAADRAPGRIAQLVYLDAFVPENGKCLLDYAVPERAARMREEGERTGYVTPPPMSLWGLTQPEHLAFVGQREVRHPFATMSQRVNLSGAASAIPKTFIYCSSPATGSFDQFAAKYRRDPKWRFHELPTGHDAMLLMPEAVTQILLEKTAAS
ncbi:MAG TPA: alpha/beta hydrolase family protein [Burkholderiales bacterium]|nr:alpha/beta hydrolase family protein [Burkholderiales bacterium]